jgi:glycine oxidase
VSRRDVIVIGGGVIGLAIAWRAAEAELTVALVDDEPGKGASWAAAGMLAPVTEAHYGEEPLLALNLDSVRRYPSFVEELEAASGMSVGYRPSGTLVVAADDDDTAAIDELFRFQRELGLPVQRLRRRECRRLEPLLAPRIRSGMVTEVDHQVDSRRLVDALLAAGQREGVTVHRRRATALRLDRDRAVGVTLSDGDVFEAATVVLAAGCWSARLDGLPSSARPPVRPVKGQILRLRGSAATPLMARTVRGLVHGTSVYLVPRANGEVVVGATVEERGFDTTVTAGATYELLRDAAEIVPGVSELELVEARAGLRPGSPDNAPLLGPTMIEGLVLATGHYRHGVLLTPVTADTVTEVLVTGRAPELIAPFSPLRFAGERSPACVVEEVRS